QGIPTTLIANFYGCTALQDNPTRFPMWFGSYQSSIRPVRNYGELLKKSEQSSQLTLFHWMKFSEDTPPSEYLEQLRDWNVDAILAHRTYASKERSRWQTGGYEHWPLPVSQNILRNNRGFTLARMDLEQIKGKWKASTPPQVIQLTANTAPTDPDIVNKINQFTSKISEADKVLGVLDQEISRDVLLEAYMTSLKQTHAADMVVYSRSSIRAPLVKGELTASRLYLSLPWTTPIEILELDRSQIEQLKSLKNIAILKKPRIPEKATVVTSRFFAHLIRLHLNLSSDGTHHYGPENEYEYFSRYLEEHSLENVFKGASNEWELVFQ
ncbi:MAG: hypothetical protein AAF558_11765, partial [Verrucomicrobiota bacterium]